MNKFIAVLFAISSAKNSLFIDNYKENGILSATLVADEFKVDEDITRAILDLEIPEYKWAIIEIAREIIGENYEQYLSTLE
jgi:hypothetical protein